MRLRARSHWGQPVLHLVKYCKFHIQFLFSIIILKSEPNIPRRIMLSCLVGTLIQSKIGKRLDQNL